MKYNKKWYKNRYFWADLIFPYLAIKDNYEFKEFEIKDKK